MSQSLTKNITIEVFNDFTKELEECWVEFEKKSNHYFFQSFIWQKTWYQQQKKYQKKVINYSIIVKNINEIVMIIPLNIDYSYGVKKLCWSGFPFSDYNAPLIKKDYDIKQESFLIIWEKIINCNKDFDCICFDNLPEKISNLYNPFFKFLKKKINNYSYGIEFNEIFKIKKKELANIKYQTNRLKNLGKLDFKTAMTNEDSSKILNFIISNKSKQYDRTNAWNLFNLIIHRELFESSNSNMNENIDLSYLVLDDHIIAAQYGYKYNKRYYYLFPTYKYEYRKFSPGKILLQKMIEKRKLESFNFFDLTIGSEDYKEKFSNYKMASALFLQSKNLRGLIYISLLKIKYLIKSKINNDKS